MQDNTMNNLCNYNYTLEKHLKYLCDNDKEYELLYSIWDLNKKNLTQGLNVVSTNYPNYSLHDSSHSYSIIDNIQSFLGTERIKHLGATDTFLLLMASLTHDIGMILSYHLIEKEWNKDSFQDTLNGFAKNDDKIISDAAKLLLSLGQKDDLNKAKTYVWALEVKNAVTIITAEIFRDKHNLLSSDYLTNDSEFKKLAENFHSEQLPNRFMDLLANVAFLHGKGFDEVMSNLYYKADGLQGDYIHPRFIACMLRLGDLLDFDSNRFNAYANASLREMPDISKAHKEKHASVKHKLVSPSAIEAELDCPNEKVYRIARSWFDWLENEVNNQSREWSKIAPESLGGLPPVISKDSVKILYNGISTTPELLNLRFTMSQKKIFEILQGGGIYKEPGFAFIREIVQNAFDASKIQMWKDIKAGFYDSYFHDQNKNADNIEFPNDIDSSIYNQYPVKLSIKWKDEERNVLHFECEDHGTGISEASLIRMTQHVGESHTLDSDYNNMYKSMPYWIRPTAAFGIGLQSVFFVASAFEVETCFPGETTKRIIFRTAADNQYSSIVEENIPRKRGTTIKVDISKERFAELFGTSFSWNILNRVDVFQGEGDDVYLAKIDDFVINTFKGIEWIAFEYEPENSERRFKASVSLLEKKFETDGEYRFRCEVQNGVLAFIIYEKRFGSTITLCFDKEFKEYSIYQRLLLRDVLVSNEKFYYYLTCYLGFEWNLNNQTSDKIVDLSRDNLTNNGRRWVADALLKELLPDIIRIIETRLDSLIDNYGSELNEWEAQYINYCLTALSFHIDIEKLSRINNLKLPKNIVSYDDKEISVKQLAESQSLLLVVGGFRTNGYRIIVPEDQQKIQEQCKDILNNNCVIWGDSYLHTVLLFNYHCSKVLKWDKECSIIELQRNVQTDNKPCLVECEISDYILDIAKSDFHRCSRSTIYSLKKYSQIVVHSNYVSGFEQFPAYSNCVIYSPFSDTTQVSELIDATKNYDYNETCNYIRKKMSEYITSSLMRVLIHNNINSSVTEEQIIDGYVALLSDFLIAKKGV